jgi:sugar phosphate isomerase/epimerase
VRVAFYKTLWGMESMGVSAALEKIAAAGYEGFETPLPGVKAAWDAGIRMPAIAMLFETDPDSLRRNLSAAVEAGAEAINIHAGKDWWTFDHGSAFFEAALRSVEEAKVPVTFETHRGRLLFEPQSTAKYLERFPEMRITADFSHWTCVCESLLDDQRDQLDLAIRHTSLIHARVGHEEGPQVPDPRSERWTRYVDKFETWWDRIKQEHEKRDETVLRVDPEFGPPHYLWTDPQDGRHLADQWEVSLWMRDRLRNRWSGPR